MLRVHARATASNKMQQQVRIMDDLLTTTELQDLLKLDRTTVYRMLKDGRLRGVKVGQQWRFPRQAIDGLLSEPPRPQSQPTSPVAFSLPIHCVQTIQDLFADLAEVAVLTVDLTGNVLTEPSGDRQTAPLLRRAGSQVARLPGRIPQQIDDGSGQQYAIAPIVLDGRPQALLIAGPLASPTPPVFSQRLARLATSIESLGSERAAMIARLNRITALSTFAEDVPAASAT
jgi:excisionase family DNA binding protein